MTARKIIEPPVGKTQSPPRQHAGLPPGYRWHRTWREKTQDAVLLTLANGSEPPTGWDEIAPAGLQTEVLYSSVPWQQAGENEQRLAYDLCALQLAWHRKVVLCATAGGCEAVLRTLCRQDSSCTAVILRDPCLATGAGELVRAAARRLAAQGAPTLIVCSAQNTGCLPYAWLLAGQVHLEGGSCLLQATGSQHGFTETARHFLAENGVL